MYKFCKLEHPFSMFTKGSGLMGLRPAVKKNKQPTKILVREQPTKRTTTTIVTTQTKIIPDMSSSRSVEQRANRLSVGEAVRGQLRM